MPEESKTQSHLATVTSMVQVLSVVAGVVISVAAFFAAQAKESDQRKAEAETRRLELQKREHDERIQNEQAARESLRPFLELRQQRYLDAIRAAAVLIASEAHKPDEVKAAHKRFFELYWGELSMVEDKNVETAMIALAKVIDQEAIKGNDAQLASLNLAHALRDSLIRSWHLAEVPSGQ